MTMKQQEPGILAGVTSIHILNEQARESLQPDGLPTGGDVPLEAYADGPDVAAGYESQLAQIAEPKADTVARYEPATKRIYFTTTDGKPEMFAARAVRVMHGHEDNGKATVVLTMYDLPARMFTVDASLATVLGFIDDARAKATESDDLAA
jgi:hypothetical protein